MALAIGAIVYGSLRAPAAAHDFAVAFERLQPARLPWLAAAIVAEFCSFFFYARIQANLLAAGGERVPTGTLLRLSIASSGLRALLPAGVVPSSGWLYEQYRHIETPPELSLFTVLASGFVSTVTLLGILLVAAGIAGVGAPVVLVISGVVLVGGSTGFVVISRRVELLGTLVEGHDGRVAKLVRRAVAFSGRVATCRPGWRRGTVAFADAAGNWLCDVVCLIGAFSLLDLPVPWRGLLFAYAAAQLGGSIVPLPGGIGAVEGSLVGALALTGVQSGDALAAAIVYRVITYWGVAVIGGVELARLVRHPPGPATPTTVHELTAGARRDAAAAAPSAETGPWPRGREGR